jgi:predicted glutamine amidotransferase
MCRLFGFRSAVNIGVHHSLVLAENALALQSHSNPDGWGIGFFEGDQPLIRRGVSKAIGDGDFSRLARFVRSHAVIAHVRLGTIGGNCLENTHPFGFGPWIFAHNGSLRQMHLYEEALLQSIDPDLRSLLRGETDSERCFYVFLTELRRLGADLNQQAPGRLALDAMAATLACVVALAKQYNAEPPGINFIATDGRSMAAARLGRGLFFSTQKHYCEKMHECSRWREGEELPCMHPLRAAEVNHLLISSERISAEDIWEPLAEGELVGIDDSFRFIREPALSEATSVLDERYADYYPVDGQDALHEALSDGAGRAG